MFRGRSCGIDLISPQELIKELTMDQYSLQVQNDKGMTDTIRVSTDHDKHATFSHHQDNDVSVSCEHDKDATKSSKHENDDEISSEHDKEIKISQEQFVAPDGGWGWFVVLSAFIGNLLTDGTIGTFGIFYPYIESEFQSSPALTSLTGSLVPTIFLMSALFTGALIHRFGCRKVSVIGGFIATCGLATASVCDNIASFAVFYGFVGGLGIGMNSLCGHLIVNTYFNKKRGFANGLVSSGAGVGVFVLAPLLQYLLENYSWRGTLLIYSGCVLQYSVCGMLMRPLSARRVGRTCDNDSDTQETSSSESDPGFSQSDQPLLKHKSVVVIEAESQNVPKIFHSQDVGQKPFQMRKYFASMFHINNDGQQSFIRNSLPDLSKSRDANNVFSHRQININESQSKSGQPSDGVVHIPEYHNSSHLNPLDRKDIFYSGSIYNLEEFQKAGSVSGFITNMAEVETETSEAEDDYQSLQKTKGTSLRRRFRSRTSRLIDVSVFRNNVYVPVLLSGVFLQMGQFIPLTFLPKYCDSIGLTSSDVTVIISIYGITNIFGRLSAGCLANMECISTLWLCTFGNSMCAVACALFPFCNTLETLCLYAAGFGYFIGYFCPLQVIIMVEYLGIEKLTSAYGILQLCKGPAALFGPPLAGMVYQMTTDYNISLVVAAVLFTLSALIQATVPLVDRISRKS